ncbi:MAG: lipoate--protein ligase [Eubacteriales bacterium]
MIYIYNSSSDPFFNLAFEQYLLDNCSDEVFLLWRNSSCVVIGKNQNAYAEVNRDFVREHDIKVVRRLTGGGAVFHDMGNVNYTFIVPQDKALVMNFEYFTRPVIAALDEMGLKSELSGRNDILACGCKISGNAQCVYNGKVMHHGTLLFDADMSRLAGALNVDERKIKAKGIQSVRSRVANIRSLLGDNITMDDFIESLRAHITSLFGTKQYVPDNAFLDGVTALRNSKYATDEWNWGRGVPYSFKNSQYYPFGLVEACFDVRDGKIQNMKFNGDFFGEYDIAGLEQTLNGVSHERAAILLILDSVELSKYIAGADSDKISDLFV